MNSPGVVPKAHVVIALAVMALLLTLAAACGGESVRNNAPPGETPTVSAAPGGLDESSGPPGYEAGPDFLYAIENPVLECKAGASWLSLRTIGPVLREVTVLSASPITPGLTEGSFDSVGGLRSVDAQVISSQRAADVIGERDYLDDSILASSVEAELPAFLTESEYAQFQVVLLTKHDESDPAAFSNSLILETSSARC